MKELLIYSKVDCCLCEEALEILTRVRTAFPFELKKIDIMENKDLYDQFRNEIPVVYVNSKKAFKYRVDESKLIRLLR
jgi:glutaredoxin-like protein DUF836